MAPYTDEQISTMIAQFIALAPNALWWLGRLWLRSGRVVTDPSTPNFPAVGFSYFSSVGDGRLLVRLALDVSADTYEVRITALGASMPVDGQILVEDRDVYVDQLGDLQRWVDAAPLVQGPVSMTA